MLEKIGLPAKPSLRGNNWVVDASHCQGCASQFTFFLRKHHCRRCGGLFCNNCTSQRMLLRGQGDSPVPICDPCKKLEEAARFELRHGSRNRAAKGVIKPGSASEEPHIEDAKGGGGVRQLSFATTNDSEQNSPEDLRRQALEERKTYKLLKGEGKSAEALKAFKRSKELERQAGALEIARRKNQRRRLESASPSSSSFDGYGASNMSKDFVQNTDVPDKNKKDRTDFGDELRELGWSERDLIEADKKPDKLSLESELSHLVKGAPEDFSKGSDTSVADNPQVIAHKKKAVKLKKEGKLAEAKEELKKAKILEKQIEEMSILAEIEDSDDELPALMLEMNKDKDTHHDLFATNERDNNIDLSRLLGMANDLVLSDDLEVTDDDINDPEMASALKSFGWDEELENSTVPNIVKPTTSGTMDSRNEIPKIPIKSKAAIQRELLSLKRNALALRRQGRLDEAEEELKKGKMLELQLQEEENGGKRERGVKIVEHKQKNIMAKEIGEEREEEDVTTQDMQDPALLSLLRDLGWKDEESQVDIFSEQVSTIRDNPVSKNSFKTSGKKRKSMAEIQRELLGVKRTARSLRQQGKHEEAEEQLRTAKVLEKELSEIENPSTKDASSVTEDGEKMVSDVINGQHDPSVDVSDRDMEDPESSEALKGLGWQENEPSKCSPAMRSDATKSNITDVSKAQVNIRAATEVDVSPQLAEFEAVSYNTPMSLLSKTVQAPDKDSPEDSESEGKLEGQDEMLYNRIKNVVSGKEEETLFSQRNWSQGEKSSQKNEYSCQESIKALKVKALALKREGKIAEAREELRQAKLLEKSLVDGNAVMVERKQLPVSASAADADSPMEEVQPNTKSSPLSSRERFKLQQQCLALKRRARKLQMEGKVEEAMSELESAKAIERQLEASGAGSASSATKKVEHNHDVNVEDFLDPQLISALTAIGLHDVAAPSTIPVPASAPAPAPAPVPTPLSRGSETAPYDKESDSLKHDLEEQIKIEKKRALSLKQAGKRAEALDALRRAKQLEKKLSELSAS